MNLPDITNGFFEGIGGLAVWLNVYKIYQAKMFRGVSSWSTIFFNLWGIYNLYFYPHLSLWYSFLGGCVIVTGNTAWLTLAWRYRNT